MLTELRPSQPIGLGERSRRHDPEGALHRGSLRGGTLPGGAVSDQEPSDDNDLAPLGAFGSGKLFQPRNDRVPTLPEGFTSEIG